MVGVLDTEEADAFKAPGPAAATLDVVAFIYGEPGPVATCALEELVLVELVLVLEGLMPEEFMP